MDWLRLWHDMPTDPKWRVIAKRSGQSISTVIAVYNFMLVCASESVERGTLTSWKNVSIAAALDIDEADVLSIYDAMQGMVLDGDRLTGWQRRQPNREDYSTPRVAKHRSKNETQCNADETQCNAMKRNETPDKEEIRRDKEKNRKNTAALPMTKEIDVLLKIDPALQTDLANKDRSPDIERLLKTAKKIVGQFGAAEVLRAWDVLSSDQWYSDKGFNNVWYLFGDDYERAAVKIRKLLAPRNGTIEPELKRNWVGGKPI